MPQWSSEAIRAASQDDKQGPLVFRLMRHGWILAIARYIDVSHLPMEEVPERSATDVPAFLSKLKDESAEVEEAVAE